MNLPATALRIAGQGLGMAGKGAMGAAKFGGRTMVSPGMIGSMARWTVASMVISSLPNPAARQQAIDKALSRLTKLPRVMPSNGFFGNHSFLTAHFKTALRFLM